MSHFEIQPIMDAQRPRVRELLVLHWGSIQMVTRGRLVDVSILPGFIAWNGEKPIGLITYEISDDACEIAVLQSLHEGKGIGTALIEAVAGAARRQGCRRLWLITTNDNLRALRFYQKRSFHLVAVHCNAMEQARLLKPEIPLIGYDGIPLRDEIELAMEL